MSGPTRQVAFFQGKRAGQQSHTDRMKAKIDSAAGKHMIAARFATVDGQWKLYCMMHNIEKLAHHGYGE